MTATVHHPAVRHPAAGRRHPVLPGPGARSQRQPCVRHPQPNYVLRRLAASLLAVVTLVLAAYVAVGAAGALAGLDSRPAAASETAPAAGGAVLRTVHVAEPGDTLWSIADRYRGEVDRGRFVDRLIDLNGGTSIQAGQAVRLP